MPFPQTLSDPRDQVFDHLTGRKKKIHSEENATNGPASSFPNVDGSPNASITLSFLALNLKNSIGTGIQ